MLDAWFKSKGGGSVSTVVAQHTASTRALATLDAAHLTTCHPEGALR